MSDEASRAGARPLRLVQITDTHLLGHPAERFEGVDTAATLARVVAHLRARREPMDALLLTGDLVQDPSPAAYRRLLAILEPLAVPGYCLPGNHDDPVQMAASLRGTPLALEPVAGFGPWELLFLNSHVPGSHGGRLAAPELEALERRLSATRAAHLLVAVHHQPVPIGSAWMDAMGLDNGAELLGILERESRVRAVIWGHIHQVFEAEHRGIRLLGSPSTCVQFRPRAKDFAIDPLGPGYRWLHLHPDGSIDSGVEWVDRPVRGSS